MPLDIEKLRSGTLEALRGREWSDKQISGMTPEKVFDEYCGWHLGHSSWGESLRVIYDDAKAAQLKNG